MKQILNNILKITPLCQSECQSLHRLIKKNVCHIFESLS